METVGIDISKLTFDARVHTSQVYQSFDNDAKGYRDLVSWVTRTLVHQKRISSLYLSTLDFILINYLFIYHFGGFHF